MAITTKYGYRVLWESDTVSCIPFLHNPQSRIHTRQPTSQLVLRSRYKFKLKLDSLNLTYLPLFVLLLPHTRLSWSFRLIISSYLAQFLIKSTIDYFTNLLPQLQLRHTMASTSTSLLIRDEKPTSTFLKSGVPAIIIGVYVYHLRQLPLYTYMHTGHNYTYTFFFDSQLTNIESFSWPSVSAATSSTAIGGEMRERLRLLRCGMICRHDHCFLSCFLSHFWLFVVGVGLIKLVCY